MKATHLVLLFGAVTLPQLALADLPTPQNLGIARGALQVCTEVDPRDASVFDQMWRSLIGGASEKQIKAAQGPEYQRGLDAIVSESKTVSKETASDLCAAFAAQWKGTTTRGDDDQRASR